MQSSTAKIDGLLIGLSAIGVTSLQPSCAAAQAAGCTGEPSALGVALQPGSVHYYAFDSKADAIDKSPNGGYSPEAQFDIAFKAWTNANQQSGNATQFLPADAHHPADIVVSNDPSLMDSNGAYTRYTTTGKTITAAVISVHSNAQFPGGGALCMIPLLPGMTLLLYRWHCMKLAI